LESQIGAPTAGAADQVATSAQNITRLSITSVPWNAEHVVEAKTLEK